MAAHGVALAGAGLAVDEGKPLGPGGMANGARLLAAGCRRMPDWLGPTLR